MSIDAPKVGAAGGVSGLRYIKSHVRGKLQ